MLSVLLDPVSSAAARSRLVGAEGAVVSTVTEKLDELALVLPAPSVSFAVTLNVPLPCAAIVVAGTVTVTLPATMSVPSRV